MLRAHAAGETQACTSLDLNMTRQDVPLDTDGVHLPDGRLTWAVLQQVASDPDACWLVEGETVQPIHAFSAETQRAYSLFPTDSAPTLIAAGFTMHRIRRIDPWQDTLNKIRAAAPLRGRILDTNTGLGYTAIVAARTAASVTTVEIDPTVLEIARLNPWSRALFTTPTISQVVGDSAEVIEDLAAASFDVVIHDPPSLSLAGDLYGGAFYREVWRVLRPNGRLFHYVGNPESHQGSSVTRGVIRRLHDAGFSQVQSQPDAFGVTARKGR